MPCNITAVRRSNVLRMFRDGYSIEHCSFFNELSISKIERIIRSALTHIGGKELVSTTQGGFR